MLIQPDELKTTERLPWSPGRGVDVWAMFCACAAGDLDAVTRLVDADPSLVRSHYQYRTPLSFAVRENHVDVAAFLIDRGGLPTPCDGKGGDLLDTARERGYGEMARLLEERVSRMPPRTRGGPLSGASPLTHAAARGDIEAVRHLLAQSVDPNEPEEGNAPHGHALYAAVYRGHYDVAKLLLEHGAYPNPEVESSADALSIAIMNSDVRLIALLVAYGAVWHIPVELAGSSAS